MKGRLVLVAGIAGTGKTTLCRMIMKEWKGPEIMHIDKDDVLRKYASDKRTTPEEILKNYESEREFVYSTYYKIVEEELAKGKTILLDNPHVKELLHFPEWREKINGMARRTGSKIILIKCFLSDENEYRKRLKRRGLARDMGKIRDDETFRKFMEYEPLDFKAPEGSPEVDTSGKVDAGKVVEFIRNSEGIWL